MNTMDIFASANIRLVPVVHEQGAGHMVDGRLAAARKTTRCAC